MVELKKTIKNLIGIAVIMPLIMVGVVIWHYGTEYAFNVISVYIIMVGTVFGASRKIKEALHNLNVETDWPTSTKIREREKRRNREKE